MRRTGVDAASAALSRRRRAAAWISHAAANSRSWASIGRRTSNRRASGSVQGRRGPRTSARTPRTRPGTAKGVDRTPGPPARIAVRTALRGETWTPVIRHRYLWPWGSKTYSRSTTSGSRTDRIVSTIRCSAWAFRPRKGGPSRGEAGIGGGNQPSPAILRPSGPAAFKSCRRPLDNAVPRDSLVFDQRTPPSSGGGHFPC